MTERERRCHWLEVGIKEDQEHSSNWQQCHNGSVHSLDGRP